MIQNYDDESSGPHSILSKSTALLNQQGMTPFLFRKMMTHQVIGILNRECAVRPPGSNSAATPEEATARTISFSDHRRKIIAFQRNVFPVPP
jgi:hypothetical protein